MVYIYIYCIVYARLVLYHTIYECFNSLWCHNNSDVAYSKIMKEDYLCAVVNKKTKHLYSALRLVPLGRRERERLLGTQ